MLMNTYITKGKDRGGGRIEGTVCHYVGFESVEKTCSYGDMTCTCGGEGAHGQ
jgi:hypothetical protein